MKQIAKKMAPLLVGLSIILSGLSAPINVYAHSDHHGNQAWKKHKWEHKKQQRHEKRHAKRHHKKHHRRHYGHQHGHYKRHRHNYFPYVALTWKFLDVLDDDHRHRHGHR